MGVEIEKKFIVKELPEGYDKNPFHIIEQGYLNVHPAIRVRRQDDIYYMTYKGASTSEKYTGDEAASHASDIGKVEYNMPLDRDSYDHMIQKADGNIISKRRYLLPINEDAFSDEYLADHPQVKRAVEEGNIQIELDIFDEPFEGTIIAEVEFPDEESARNYKPAKWFSEDVTGRPEYSNAHMSSIKF